jgi:hypothetical protein
MKKGVKNLARLSLYICVKSFTTVKSIVESYSIHSGPTLHNYTQLCCHTRL